MMMSLFATILGKGVGFAARGAAIDLTSPAGVSFSGDRVFFIECTDI